ncbi:MAG: SUMF1/EgtB/PvdO family nonheme iron enzyme [Polyangiaceae bacterium]
MRPRLCVLLASWLLVTGSQLGCRQVLGLDGLEANRSGDGGGAAGGSGAGGGSGGGSGGGCSACGTPGCPPCPPDDMVETDRGYLVDVHEVTVGQYQAFLDSNPTFDGQDFGCNTWNDSFTPGVFSPEAANQITEAGLTYTPDGSCDTLHQDLLDLGRFDVPAICVDVCDARAYCRWAGKRLCGKIGGGLLNANMAGAHADPEQSEWYRVCSNAGATIYPYGDAFEFGRCNDAAHNPNVLNDVGYYQTCEGGLPGVFDMSGNAGEWTDGCSNFMSPHAAQNCLVRGGAYWGGDTNDAEGLLRCDAFKDTLLSSQSDSTGFRCCKDGS